VHFFWAFAQLCLDLEDWGCKSMNKIEIAGKLTAAVRIALCHAGVELKCPAAMGLADSVADNESVFIHAMAIALGSLDKPALLGLFRAIYAAEGQTLLPSVDTFLH
jgi:hypothetical protein